MPLSPEIRGLFSDLSPGDARRLLRRCTISVALLDGCLYLWPKNGDPILVEPCRGRGGRLELGYAVRDAKALADYLDRTRRKGKENPHAIQAKESA